MDTTIVELMRVTETARDLNWLKKSLQAAIKLEFATIPPYLAAYWSVKSQTDPVARSIRTIVVREEMLHMGLSCNLLAAVGGAPLLNSPGAVPVYPGPLPGGVHPGLEVCLQGLSEEAVRLFMEIEYPEHGPVALKLDDTFPTIGSFYTAIQAAFETLQPELAEERQLEGWLGLAKIRTVKEVQTAIQLIKRQGEGSKESPEDTGLGDLAHYYRFGEIYHKKKLQKNSTSGKWEFTGPDVPFPDVWPMAKVPAGGYRKEDVTGEVWDLLERCDRSFTDMLNHLQRAWETASEDSLDHAVDAMRGLRDPAVALMRTQIPSMQGNYGPCFRLIATA